MSIKMTAENKKFITKKLIPFVLREQGRGFAMSVWDLAVTAGAVRKIDDVLRVIPKCNTVACIGGSIQVLSGGVANSTERAAPLLGLSYGRAHGLFYGWEVGHGGWPKEFALRYARAKTTLGKARVAVALLREVVRTNGKVLDEY